MTAFKQKTSFSINDVLKTLDCTHDRREYRLLFQFLNRVCLSAASATCGSRLISELVSVIFGFLNYMY